MNMCTILYFSLLLQPIFLVQLPCLIPIVPTALPLAGGGLMKINRVTQRGLSLPPGVPLLNLTLQAPLRDHTG
jgi:hypothetical protein